MGVLGSLLRELWNPGAGKRQQLRRKRKGQKPKRTGPPHFNHRASVALAKAGISREAITAMVRAGLRQGTVGGIHVQIRYAKNSHTVTDILPK